MIDIWWGDIELTTLVLIFSALVMLPVQLLLCFRSENQTLRLLPVTVLTALTLLFLLMCVSTTGWDVLLVVVLAIFSAVMLLFCGIAWGIWAIAGCIKRRN